MARMTSGTAPGDADNRETASCSLVLDAITQHYGGTAAVEDITFDKKVQMTGEIATVLAKSPEDLKRKFVFQDWQKINEQRSAWIERLNREINA